MKKFLLTIAFSCAMFAVGAQIELGINGGYGTTWFLNNNAFDQGPNLNPNFSFGYSYGLSGSVYLTQTIGIGIEANMLGVNQKYDGTIHEVNYDSKDHVNYFQLPVMLKVKTESGFYFEAGPEFNFLTSAKGELTTDATDDPKPFADRDIQTGFNSTDIGIIFGFGGRFILNENLLLTAGLRFYGGISDATQELGKTEFYHESTAEHLGTTVTYAHLDQSGNYYYEKTTLATGGIQVGLIYQIGNKK